MASLTNGHEFEQALGVCGDRQAWRAVVHTVTDLGIDNKAKVYIFLEFSCFFNDPVDVGNLISGTSAFSKTSLNIGKFTVH